MLKVGGDALDLICFESFLGRPSWCTSDVELSPHPLWQTRLADKHLNLQARLQPSWERPKIIDALLVITKAGFRQVLRF